MKRRSVAAKSKAPSKRAKWTTEQQDLLLDQINNGESVASVTKLFPQFTPTQLHSKISNLKQRGLISKLPPEDLAPSLRPGMCFLL
jgi:hypothetical protein